MKNTLTKLSIAAAFAASCGTANAATIDLAFLMDESGSVGSSNFIAAMDSLADALEASLANVANDTYNVTVISFRGSANTVVNASITPNSSSADVKTALGDPIRADLYSGGGTCYSCAFNELGASTGDVGIINMMTDGSPNSGITSDAGLLTIRDGLMTDGWDAMSFEAVGTGASDSLLQSLAFDTAGTGAQDALTDPNDITNPLNNAFVLAVSDFGAAYNDAVATKVQRTIDTTNTIPLPGALPLLAGGLAIFGFASRRRKASAA